MSNLPANISTLVATLETAQASTPIEASGDFTYLKMTKVGEWVYGAEETEVDEYSAFVIDPASYAQGYVAWSDGELVDEKMAVAGSTPITLADLPELPAGVKWGAQVAFALKGVEGADEGMQLMYKVSSRGGKEAISKLLATIIKRARAGESRLCPVVMLETSSYKHKKYGKIYTPLLSIDEWVDVPDAEDEPAAKEPKVVKVAKKEPEPEKEADAPAPRRKRARAKA
tara:strand:+ start:4144 stop:4827 length:684 start_codon:yes stop_codon:yes gene_type:complete